MLQKSLPVATAGGSQRPSCRHGAACYRDSAEHKAEYAHVGDADYQCSPASSVVDLTGTEDKSPAAATAVGDADCQHHDAGRTASCVVKKIEDISRRLQGLKKSDLKHEARLLGVQQLDLDLLSDVDNVEDELKALIKVVVAAELHLQQAAKSQYPTTHRGQTYRRGHDSE
jgi:hypothetical protein